MGTVSSTSSTSAHQAASTSHHSSVAITRAAVATMSNKSSSSHPSSTAHPVAPTHPSSAAHSPSAPAKPLPSPSPHPSSNVTSVSHSSASTSLQSAIAPATISHSSSFTPTSIFEPTPRVTTTTVLSAPSSSPNNFVTKAGFFRNSGAVAAVFVSAGLTFFALLALAICLCRRRKKSVQRVQGYDYPFRGSIDGSEKRTAVDVDAARTYRNLYLTGEQNRHLTSPSLESSEHGHVVPDSPISESHYQTRRHSRSPSDTMGLAGIGTVNRHYRPYNGPFAEYHTYDQSLVYPQPTPPPSAFPKSAGFERDGHLQRPQFATLSMQSSPSIYPATLPDADIEALNLQEPKHGMSRERVVIRPEQSKNPYEDARMATSRRSVTRVPPPPQLKNPFADPGVITHPGPARVLKPKRISDSYDTSPPESDFVHTPTDENQMNKPQFKWGREDEPPPKLEFIAYGNSPPFRPLRPRRNPLRPMTISNPDAR
ncbi:hypothetical protein BD410DRAFT_760102 [Rickenella mellea]|uniref:Uncharacterized protein n=1 Tax=Rickenella mellea TaxID=50990 RepID=A0A4Y7QLY3_9AGAM|nr:hypothetical protein BD410DRAFT_760102 [Rickenella mellea]